MLRACLVSLGEAMSRLHFVDLSFIEACTHKQFIIPPVACINILS